MTTRSALLIFGVVAAALIPLGAHRPSCSDHGRDAADRSGWAKTSTRHVAKGGHRTKGMSRTTGTIRGFDRKLQYEITPDLTLELFGLPPGSRTYVRTNHESRKSNHTDDRILPGSEVVIDSANPEDRTVVLKDVNEEFTRHGRHTLEIVHEYGGEIEVLSRTSINVDRTWSGPASLYPEE